MANKRKKEPDSFSPEYVKKNRTFPKANTVWLVILVILQAAALIFAIAYTPKPQDVIKEYGITVTPLEDGTLDIEYSFVWNALDTGEELTWVEIGMANPNFTIYKNSLSQEINRAEKYMDGGYISARIYFERAYKGGETLEFSFKINQGGLLHSQGDGYFYSFVPGWFNSTPVEHYTFRWDKSSLIKTANANTVREGYYIWEGEMDCGNYVMMNVNYAERAFEGITPTIYIPFDSEDVYNQLADDKAGIVFFMIIIILGIGVAELYIVDSFVSYNRGRGFLSGYGHHVHLYGRYNRRYADARDRHMAQSSSSRGGFRGGGCACACACACAGGGRAGCSQKDTYENKKVKYKK